MFAVEAAVLAVHFNSHADDIVKIGEFVLCAAKMANH